MSGDEGELGEEVHQLLGELARWAAESRTADEADVRSRHARLTQQAAETTMWSSLVLGWAESDTQVRLTTVAGRVHLGRLRAVGRDFVLLRPAAAAGAGRSVLVAMSGIAFVGGPGLDRSRAGPLGPSAPARQAAPLPPPLEGPATHDPMAGRDQTDDADWIGEAGSTPGAPISQTSALVDLAGAVAELVSSRPRLRIVTGLGPSVVGELRWVGSDTICLLGEGSPPTPTYIRLATVVEVSVL